VPRASSTAARSRPRPNRILTALLPPARVMRVKRAVPVEREARRESVPAGVCGQVTRDDALCPNAATSHVVNGQRNSSVLPHSNNRGGRVALRSTNGHHVDAMAKGGQLLPGSGGSGEVSVVFDFRDSAEVRYLSRPPAPGTRVRSSNGHVWIVSNVIRSGENTFRARCVGQQDRVSARATASRPEPAPRDPATTHRALAEADTTEPGVVEELGVHVATLARRAIGAPTRLRRRYGMRRYMP
jgi:hypothetical protein